MNHNPLIVALDFDNAEAARSLVRQLGENVDFYKIGMELYAAEGIDLVRELLREGKKVFLDLKFYDISETVKRAVAVVARTGVQFLTVHGSDSILRAAVEGRAGSDLKLLAVTVLTSFNQQDLAELGSQLTVAELVRRRARAATASGVEGVVCSALEVASVRETAGPNAILVTPGVRSKGADPGDQQRVATPAEAIAAGADYLVIGRQVTRSRDPRGEVLRIRDEIGGRAVPVLTPDLTNRA